jgi:hypothetical protein
LPTFLKYTVKSGKLQKFLKKPLHKKGSQALHISRLMVISYYLRMGSQFFHRVGLKAATQAYIFKLLLSSAGF